MSPNCLNFTPEQIETLIDRLNNKCLQEEDYSLLADVVRAMVWMSCSLQEKELSIKRLRQIFGIKTESAAKLLEIAKGSQQNQDNGAENIEKEDQEKKTKAKSGKNEKSDAEKAKNHGHRPSTDYSEAKVIDVAHQALKKGDMCPDCLKGKLFCLKPGTVISIVGHPWLQVHIYRPERLRCSLCGKVFTAILPQEVFEGSRADDSAKAIVTLLKYRGGVPFYRQGQIQEILGLPISASEIWEMTENVADVIQPIYAVLCKEAANGEVIHNDDTTAKILSRIKELKENPNDSRSGTFTTCILAILKNATVKIALLFTGKKHAGENLDELLNLRSKELPPPIQECDALSRNIPQNHETQVANCLAHLRRKFYELVETWPQEVAQIIGEFSLIFANEHEAPTDPHERLAWHKRESGPVMERLKIYCNSLVENKKVEPNSSLGKAVAYLNNHWQAFTLFLRVPDVPLTNNADERLIKKVVLNRKNAYFFRNETGAKIADILMSVIETCVFNQVNPYQFMLAAQKHKKDVRRYPHLWVPWLYEARLKELSSSQAI